MLQLRGICNLDIMSNKEECASYIECDIKFYINGSQVVMLCGNQNESNDNVTLNTHIVFNDFVHC